MSYRVLALLVTGLALQVGCSDDARPNSPYFGSGGNTGGGKSGGSGSGAASSGGDGSGEGGEGNGEGGDGQGGNGQGGDAEGGVGNVGHLGGIGGVIGGGGGPPKETPDCDPDGTWGTATGLSGFDDSGADETLLAITADELTIAVDIDGDLFIADRDSTGDDFGTPAAVPTSVNYTHEKGASLSSDGLKLVLVAGNESTFYQLSRAERGNAFTVGPSDASKPFASITTLTTQTLLSVGYPAVADSGVRFYFVGKPSTGDTAESHAYVSPSGSGYVWESPSVMDQFTLNGSSGNDRNITGMAPDDLNLYIFNEAKDHVEGWWRDSKGQPFYTSRDFEDLLTAQVAGACSSLYSTQVVGSSLDIVVQVPE